MFSLIFTILKISERSIFARCSRFYGVAVNDVNGGKQFLSGTVSVNLSVDMRLEVNRQLVAFPEGAKLELIVNCEGVDILATSPEKGVDGEGSFLKGTNIPLYQGKIVGFLNQTIEIKEVAKATTLKF